MSGVLQCSGVLLNRALGSTCDVAAAQTVQSQGHVRPEYHDWPLKIKCDDVIFHVSVSSLLFFLNFFSF